MDRAPIVDARAVSGPAKGIVGEGPEPFSQLYFSVSCFRSLVSTSM
jgi:hypothetical protein